MAKMLFEFVGTHGGPLLIFACVGVYLFWIVGYGFMIHDAWKKKTYGVPIVSVAVMWAYEFCFLFLWKVPIPLWQALELVWFIADSILLVQVVLYARNTMVQPYLARIAPGIVLWAALACTAAMGCFIWFFELTDGVVPAVVAVTLVSVFFPIFATLHPHGGHLSTRGQSCRALGDVCTALCVWLIFPWVGFTQQGESPSLNNAFVNVMLVVMLLSDAVMVFHTLPSMKKEGEEDVQRLRAKLAGRAEAAA